MHLDPDETNPGTPVAIRRDTPVSDSPELHKERLLRQFTLLHSEAERLTDLASIARHKAIIARERLIASGVIFDS